jgi:GAF domain-containing protein
MNKEIIERLKSLVRGEKVFIANASNAASLLYHSLDSVNWVGFYLASSEELILGPFCGKPACLRIPFGKGVCGTVFISGQTVIVADVHNFRGHIACDANSRSEIVVPLFYLDKVIGVLDVDSPVLDRFGVNEKDLLEECAKIIIDESDIERIIEYYK